MSLIFAIATAQRSTVCTRRLRGSQERTNNAQQAAKIICSLKRSRARVFESAPVAWGHRLRKTISQQLLFIAAFLFIVLSNHSIADELSIKRISYLTNNLAKAKGGVRMLVRYMDNPGLTVPTGSIDGGHAYLPPREKVPAEITTRGNEFEWDETVATNIFRFQDVTHTNYGLMSGRRTINDINDTPIGSEFYYWVPHLQFSYTTITNDLPDPGGWVESVFRRFQQMSDRIIYLSLPPVDLGRLYISETLAGAARGPNAYLVTIASNSPTLLALRVYSSNTNVYQLNVYKYSSQNDNVPEDIDTYMYYLTAPVHIQHRFSVDIMRTEYIPDELLQNPPQKVVDDTQSPRYRGFFEVSAKEQVQIVGTNRIPVLRELTRASSRHGFVAGRIISVGMILLSIISFYVLWKLTVQTSNNGRTKI